MSNTQTESTPQPFNTPDRPAPPNRSLVAVLSALIGLIIGAATIVGGLGSAYFVGRAEYTQQRFADTQDKAIVSRVLEKLDSTMLRQETEMGKMSTAVEKLTESLQAIKLDLARRK